MVDDGRGAGTRAFYRGFARRSAALALGSHAALAKVGVPYEKLGFLRRLVHGGHRGDRLTLELRRGTIDAWLAHPGCEAETHRWIAARFDGTGILIDVGAFVGFFALRASPYFERVIAIEASSGNFKGLQRNLALNQPHSVTAIKGAAAQEPGEIKLYLSQDDTHSTIGSGPCEIVEAITLDDLWAEAGRPRVALLKIDVEGAEPLVLAGARALLESGCIVLAEANDELAKARLVETLEPSGYRLGGNLDHRNYWFAKA